MRPSSTFYGSSVRTINITNFRPDGRISCICPSVDTNESVHCTTLVASGCPNFDCNSTQMNATQMLDRQDRINQDLEEQLSDLSIQEASENSDLPTFCNLPAPTDSTSVGDIQNPIHRDSLFRVNTVNERNFNAALQETETRELTLAKPTLTTLDIVAAVTPSKHSIKPDALSAADCLPTNYRCYAIVNSNPEAKQSELISPGTCQKFSVINYPK